MADVDIYQFTSAQPVQQKLIKTAYLTLQVDRIEQVYANTKELISQSGGFIANDDMNNYPERKSRNMVIRVPSEKLETLVDQLSAQGGYVESRNINVNDVSEEFIDVEIRLQNKRAVLEQYRKLLDKATKVEDILKIENELRQISEEIESKEGRLRFLSDRVKLSTIHLNMYEEIALAQAPPAASFWIQALESLKSGWSMMVALCLLVLRLWPILLMIALIWIVIRIKRPLLKS